MFDRMMQIHKVLLAVLAIGAGLALVLWTLSGSTRTELAKLEKEGVIGGGMIPKCRSAAVALKQGLKKVEFVDGRVSGNLTNVVKGKAVAGTVLKA